MGPLLKRLREKAGLSVAQAATALGVHRQTVYYWEQGDKEPDKPALRAAMDVYNATPEERDEVARLRAFGEPDHQDEATA